MGFAKISLKFFFQHSEETKATTTKILSQRGKKAIGTFFAKQEITQQRATFGGEGILLHQVAAGNGWGSYQRIFLTRTGSSRGHRPSWKRLNNRL